MSLLDDADLMGDADLLTHVPNTATHKEVEGIWYPKHAEYRLPKLPEDDDELWLWMQAIWGMRIPRTRVCEHHSTPFEAFADAYFARNPVAIWKASRGFGGKSRLLASLVLQEACFLPAQVTILGGSGAQSLIVHAHTVESWSMPHAPKHLMTEDPTKYDTRLANGAWIRSLMASQSSVRGPHPQRLRLDEIDEMELEILEASQGQPMRGRIGPQKGIETQTVMSSTHQYPDKTMTAMLKRASENGWPIYEWCVGKGQHILTEAHGAVPIERLEPGTHRVLTRDGWRDLQHVTYMGDKPTVTLETTAGELICTADHKVATPDGWAEAGSLLPGALVVTASSGTLALPADPPAPVRDDEVGAAELMPLGTQRVPLPVGPRPAGVLTGGHRVQMPDVHARRVPAGVVEVQVVTDGADQFGPDPAVGVGRGATQVLDPVVTSHGVGPRDAVIGVDVEVDGLDGPLNPSEPIAARLAPDAAGVLQGHTTVVAVRDHGLVLPVYDIGVYGTHEFVIDGSEMVISNCWRESANPVDGWLTHDEVERKRNEIAAHMWETEYDLQEPSFEGRAIDSAAVNACFDPALGVTDEFKWESATHQRPVHPRYVTGVDWAKQKDRTVIATFDARGDDEWECVAWEALTRTPWPHMVGQAERRLRAYPPVFGHDATGLGNVVSDFFDPTLVSRYKGNFKDVLMASGRARHDMFTEYVSAIESGKIRYPRIDLAYREHLYCGLEDLYGKGHPPDSVVAGAIAWSLRGTGRRIVAAPQSMGGRTSPWSI